MSPFQVLAPAGCDPMGFNQDWDSILPLENPVTILSFGLNPLSSMELEGVPRVHKIIVESKRGEFLHPHLVAPSHPEREGERNNVHKIWTLDCLQRTSGGG